MAEKDQRQTYPLAPANGYSRSDEEAASEHSKELRRKKCIKYTVYGVAFAIFQTGVILVFVLFVMKVRTPKFRVRSATFETFDVVASNPSFNLNMNAELSVKNKNFGQYEFENSTIIFLYRGLQVGSALVSKAKVGILSTKKFNVVVDLSSTGLPSNSMLGSDLNSGFLPLSSQAQLTGKVKLMMVMKKKKATEMNCTMEVNISTKELQNLMCK